MFLLAKKRNREGEYERLSRPMRNNHARMTPDDVLPEVAATRSTSRYLGGTVTVTTTIATSERRKQPRTRASLFARAGGRGRNAADGAGRRSEERAPGPTGPGLVGGTPRVIELPGRTGVATGEVR